MVLHSTEPVRAASRAARPSADEIDSGILDAAAEEFARHGFAGTSVQQVADAVGYSKTGLLRRFPSKQALYDAAVNQVVHELQALRRGPGGRPGGDGLLAHVTAVAFDHPGAVLLMLEAVRGGTDLPGADRLTSVCDELLDELLTDLTGGAPDPADQLRAVLALQLVAHGSLLVLDPGPVALDLGPDRLREVVARSAADVLAAGRG